jgi:ketosteroid isomerase-like protein
MNERERELSRLYAAFNARDIDTVLSALHPDVEWPNGWEGGWLHGRDAVRAYWLRQWSEIDPSVEPIAFSHPAPDRVAVSVHQVVRDRTGATVFDGTVIHTYAFAGRLVQRMEIGEP